jgi:hypothetical protein
MFRSTFLQREWKAGTANCSRAVMATATKSLHDLALTGLRKKTTRSYSE